MGLTFVEGPANGVDEGPANGVDEEPANGVEEGPADVNVKGPADGVEADAFGGLLGSFDTERTMAGFPAICGEAAVAPVVKGAIVEAAAAAGVEAGAAKVGTSEGVTVIATAVGVAVLSTAIVAVEGIGAAAGWGGES